MKKFKKSMSLVLVLVMVLSFAACGNKGSQNQGQAGATTYVNPYADLAGDYDELSQAVYDDVLGEFYTYYMDAMDEETDSMRYAKMAIAEAKMLGAGIFLPPTSKGGNYAMSRKAPYTNTPILWGNDTYRYHDVIVTTDPIEAAHYAEMKAQWTGMVGTGEYEAWAKNYLTEKGYTIKDNFLFYYDADPETWDVLATSNAADSEVLVNTYDGLVEYDMEQQPQPALATSWEKTNNDDGTQTWTFKLREDVVWVDRVSIARRGGFVKPRSSI